MKRLPRRPVTIIGVPMDLGAGRRGTDMGPSAVRLAGLHDSLAANGFDDVEDKGDLDVPAVETLKIVDAKAKHLPAIAATCKRLAKEVRAAMKAGRVPVTIGGDHSVAIGSISAVSAHFKKEKKKLGVVWIDAHGDMNTPATTGSGNVHGMPLAAVLGMGAPALTEIEGKGAKLDADRVALVGIRDLDFGEMEVIQKSGVHVFTMKEIDERGIADVMRDAIRIAGGLDAGPIHVSFDVDGVDPRFAPGVGTAVDGGLTYREAHLAMEMVAETQRLCSVDVVEINPVLDVANRTGRLAMELILSALGKRIYVA
jgi:arginase